MYSLLIILAVILNWRQKKALLLALLVGLGAVLPIPQEYGAAVWYILCGGVELIILISAIILRSSLSIPVVSLSTLFIFVHALGWKFDGFPPDSPYHYSAITIEYTELFLCVILSNPIINFLREKIK